MRSYFLSDTNVGGAQRTIINLVNRMNEINIDVNLVVALEGGEARKWLNEGVSIIELNASRTRWALFRLRKVLLRLKPDVLVATMVDANILATLASVGLRKKMRLILRETNSHRARGDIKLLRRLLIKWSYKRADSVVALSTGVHNELLHTYGLDPDKIVTIGNPVTIQHFTKECKAKEIRKLGVVSEDFPIIIAIGRRLIRKVLIY